MFAQKLDNVIENNLLSESQYGFRSNRCMAQAIIKIIEITTAIDKEIYIGGIH